MLHHTYSAWFPDATTYRLRIKKMNFIYKVQPRCFWSIERFTTLPVRYCVIALPKVHNDEEVSMQAGTRINISLVCLAAALTVGCSDSGGPGTPFSSGSSTSSSSPGGTGGTGGTGGAGGAGSSGASVAGLSILPASNTTSLSVPSLLGGPVVTTDGVAAGVNGLLSPATSTTNSVGLTTKGDGVTTLVNGTGTTAGAAVGSTQILTQGVTGGTTLLSTTTKLDGSGSSNTGVLRNATGTVNNTLGNTLGNTGGLLR
jgi:hypothetical protein